MVEDRPESLDASTASSLHRKMTSSSNSVSRKWFSARARTDIKTSHVLKTLFVIASAEYPCYVVCKGDGVCSKSVSRKRAPYRCLAPVHHRRRCRLDVLHIREMGDRAKKWG